MGIFWKYLPSCCVVPATVLAHVDSVAPNTSSTSRASTRTIPNEKASITQAAQFSLRDVASNEVIGFYLSTSKWTSLTCFTEFFYSTSASYAWCCPPSEECIHYSTCIDGLPYSGSVSVTCATDARCATISIVNGPGLNTLSYIGCMGTNHVSKLVRNTEGFVQSDFLTTSASALRTSPEQAAVTSTSSSTHSSQTSLPETTEQAFISSTSSSAQPPENPRPSTSDQNSISSTPISETFRTSASDHVSSSASSTSPASAQQSETSLPTTKNKDSSINPIALGIPLGLGIPLVIAALIFIFLKRRRSKPKAPYSDTIPLSKRGEDLRYFPSSQASPRLTSPGFYHLAKASPSELSAARPLVEAPANEVGPVELPTSHFDNYWSSHDGDAE